MIDFENQTSYSIDIKRVQTIAKELTKRDIELIVTDNAHIQSINKEFRGKDTPTDVLSFPYEAMKGSPLGSIVISYDYVKSAAEKFSHSEEDEFVLLFIHGLLHILGFDHEKDNGEMRKKESEIIKKHGLPDSLIVRTEG